MNHKQHETRDTEKKIAMENALQAFMNLQQPTSDDSSVPLSHQISLVFEYQYTSYVPNFLEMI